MSMQLPPGSEGTPQIRELSAVRATIHGNFAAKPRRLLAPVRMPKSPVGRSSRTICGVEARSKRLLRDSRFVRKRLIFV